MRPFSLKPLACAIAIATLASRHGSRTEKAAARRHDCLDEILDRFLAANVRFVSLEEAIADPMNALVPPRVSPEFIHQVEKWALVHGVPVYDRPPPILDEVERLNPAPGESAAESGRGSRR